MKILALSLFVLLTCAIVIGSAAAQGEGPTPSPDEVNAIAANLYCPVCANVPLDACGTAACAQWRQQIADLLTQGYSEQQIYDYFVQQYGPSVLATPPAEGFNWLIYLLPPTLVIFAAFFLGRGLLKWKKPAGNKPFVSRNVMSSKYSRQLEKQLKDRR